MPNEAPQAPIDRDDHVLEYYHGMQRAYLKTVVCDEVIAEFNEKPFGQHSEPLERLLHYFRRLPLEGQYAIKRDGATGRCRVVVLSGVRGVPPRLLDDREYATVEDAYRAVFAQHVDDLMGS